MNTFPGDKELPSHFAIRALVFHVDDRQSLSKKARPYTLAIETTLWIVHQKYENYYP